MPDRRGNIKCKDPVKLAAMAAANAAGPSAAANTHTANSDEEGQIDDTFWAKEDATDERKHGHHDCDIGHEGCSEHHSPGGARINLPLLERLLGRRLDGAPEIESGAERRDATAVAAVL